MFQRQQKGVPRETFGEWAVVTALYGLMILAYGAQGIISGFFTAGDLVSNMHPIVHLKLSLGQGQLPLFTELWYGGRPQYLNPLWSALYLPATLLWLALPLGSAGKAVLLSHLLFGALAGYLLSRRYLAGTAQRWMAGFLLSSPMFIAATWGQLEKVMAWPWVILMIRWLLLAGEMGGARRRSALLAGLCLGIIPLTGAMYYAFYAAVLFVCLLAGAAWHARDRLVPLLAVAGSSVGLAHLFSIWYLRGGRDVQVAFEVTLPQLVQTLFLLPVHVEEVHLIHESWALLGVGVLPLVLVSVRFASWEVKATALAVLLYIGLATGFLYEQAMFGWLSTMRTAARASQFLGLVLMLCALLGARVARGRGVGRPLINSLLLISVTQVAIIVFWEARPAGITDLESSGADRVASFLQQSGAHAVWVAVGEDGGPRGGQKVTLALNDRGIQTPNVYYANIGQEVPVAGPHSGLSFDWLVAGERIEGSFPLHSAIDPQTVLGTIEGTRLHLAGSFPLWRQRLHLFREGRLDVGADLYPETELFLYRVE